MKSGQHLNTSSASFAARRATSNSRLAASTSSMRASHCLPAQDSSKRHCQHQLATAADQDESRRHSSCSDSRSVARCKVGTLTQKRCQLYRIRFGHDVDNDGDDVAVERLRPGHCRHCRHHAPVAHCVVDGRAARRAIRPPGCRRAGRKGG
jgi:hypothetical protein